MKPKRNINLKEVFVVNTQLLSPHLMRLNVKGNDLADFPDHQEGGAVKVIINETKESVVSLNRRPKVRSYTIAEFDKNTKILSIDFMVNSHQGYVSSWVLSVKPGEKLLLRGPALRKVNNFIETDYLLFADLTSINVVKAIIDYAPEKAIGMAIIIVPIEEDIRMFDIKNKIEVKWLVADSSDYFVNFAKKYGTITNETIIFGAGEASKIKNLRNYLLHKVQLSGDNVFLYGYWKEGRTDEEFRMEK